MFEFPFAWVVIGSMASDLAVALVSLYVDLRRDPRPGLPDEPTAGARGPIGLGRLGRAAAAVVVFFGVKVVVLMGVTLNRFGLIHLVYVDLVGLIPLVGAILLIVEGARGPRLTRGVRLGAIASFGLLGVGYYASYVEPFRLREETATIGVPKARAGSAPLTIAVLSDIQIRRVTDYERGAIDRLMAGKPDLILIPGDVFQGGPDDFERERPAIRELLGRLEAPAGVFLAPGDTDGPGGLVARLLEGTKVVPLVNRIARVEYRDRHLSIGGIELSYASRPALDLVRELESAPGEDDIRILLAHRPDAVGDLAPGRRVDLVVAGHTHGGQVVIPGFGPPVTLSGVPRAVAAGGLHDLDGHAIYVSRGVGCERGQAPRIRVFCPPELSRLTLSTVP